MNAFSVRRFAALLFKSAPRTTLASLVLMGLVALTEGAGLLLLLPLLALAGVTGGAPAASGMWGKITPYVPHSLGGALLLYLVIVAARAALEYAESVAAIKVQVEVTRNLRERLYRALVRARWETIAPLRGARLAHVLTAELERVSLTTNQLLSGSLQLLVAIVYAVAAITLSPSTALVAAVGALLLLLPARRQQREARRAGDKLTVLGADLFAGATEEVATLKVAKSAGIAERMADRFTERARTLGEALLDAHKRYRASNSFLTVGAAAALAVVVYVAVSRLHLATASLLLLLLVCGRLVPRIAAVQSSFLLTARTLPAAEAVQALLDELEAAAESTENAPSTPLSITDSIALRDVTYRYPGASSIALRDVTYRYPGAGSAALRDVSLSIPAGRVTALVGSSGAGKSTLADVVLLLATPERGAIVVDGEPLGAERRDAWRASVGYVPQETHLFHDTIRENVRWVAPDATDAEVLEALRMAGASVLLRRLEHGLDTKIGDRGTLLSGGERQRLALARALLRRPRLLVLDEATSALDPESELSIRQTIASLTPAVTVLTITHRLTTARQADHVVVIDQGAVVAEGPWETLLAGENSRLSRLWTAQLGLDDELVPQDGPHSS